MHLVAFGLINKLIGSLQYGLTNDIINNIKSQLNKNNRTKTDIVNLVVRVNGDNAKKEYTELKQEPPSYLSN